MTVGETIQKYRKKLGMSQEELGQKLLVSRQTISQWEKGQTVPTIDNLMRLREILGVSVDELLGFENHTNDTPETELTEPKEAYSFSFSKNELTEIYNIQKKSIYKKVALFIVINTLIIILLFASSTPAVIPGILIGMAIISVKTIIKRIRQFNETWKNNIERISESTYEYSVFDDYIRLKIFRNNEKVRDSKCYISDIERIQNIGNYFLLQFGGQVFIIRKSDLMENSFFRPYTAPKAKKPTYEKAPTVWRTLSIILFVASILSWWGALVTVGFVSEINHLFVENMWILFLFSPIPLSSVVLGFVLKSKGYKYLKNLIIGIIMLTLLCVYGSFTYIFANTYDHSDKQIVKVEQILRIDIPEHKQVITQDHTSEKPLNSGEILYYSSDVYFEEDVASVFEKQLSTDEKWLYSVPNELIGITSSLGSDSYDYELIYNADTYEFNALPDQSDTYHFLNILYNEEYNHMLIIEYDINYVK